MPKNYEDLKNAELLDHLAEDPDGYFLRDLLTAQAAANQDAAKQGEFWQKMWSRYPHLETDRGLVNGIVGREMARLGGMNVNAAIDEIARLVKLEKEKLARRWDREREGSVMQSFGDGPKHGRAQDGSVGDDFDFDPKTHGLSAVIKRRRQNKREAQHSFNGNRRPSDQRKVAAE